MRNRLISIILATIMLFCMFSLYSCTQTANGITYEQKEKYSAMYTENKKTFEMVKTILLKLYTAKKVNTVTLSINTDNGSISSVPEIDKNIADAISRNSEFIKLSHNLKIEKVALIELDGNPSIIFTQTNSDGKDVGIQYRENTSGENMSELMIDSNWYHYAN